MCIRDSFEIVDACAADVDRLNVGHDVALLGMGLCESCGITTLSRAVLKWRFCGKMCFQSVDFHGKMCEKRIKNLENVENK